VLETRGFGVDDNFFNLGGTSLQSAKLLAEINRRFRIDLRLTAILEAPTVRSMAVLISQSSDHERSGLVCLNGDGEVNLFLVHDGFGETLLYLHLAKRLPAKISVYGIEPKRLTGIPLAHTSVEDMAAFYVDQIRKLQPKGPYLIGGLCAGGVIAHAMAACLKEKGEQVQMVVLLDSAMPKARKRSRRALGHRLSRLEDAAKQAYRSDSARRVRWMSIASVVARKVRNAAIYEISQICETIGVRLRFAFLKFAIRRNIRWPAALPTLSVLQIYTVLRARYTPPMLADVPVFLVRASAGEGADTPYRELYHDEDLGWRGVANRLEMADANGGHSSMLQEQVVDSVASVMTERLSAILPPKDLSQ
jgi:thioesterase domain-containing protein